MNISKSNKIIQGLWIKTPLTLMEQMSIKSFLKNGHTFHLYVYNKIKNAPKGTVFMDASEILPENRFFVDDIKSNSAFADLFRYKLLYEKGGWWSDLDVICLKPFNFASAYVFSSENTPDKKIKINNTLIKVPPKCKFMKECYEKAAKLGVPNMPFLTIATKLFPQFLIKYDLKSFCRRPRIFCPVDPWHVADLINPRINLKIPNESYSIHLWNNLWSIGKVSKNALYPKTTLYGKLQKEILDPVS